MAKSRAEEILDQIRDLVNSGYLGDSLRDELTRQLGASEELHTHPEVGHIAGIEMRRPEQLTLDQVKSLCGEVDRHIRRMKGRA